MGEPGLRAQKKAETRSRIASSAARLFAVNGYEGVTVEDVATAARVAEKTVYNYFPTKEHLVLDRDEEEITRLVSALRARPPGTPPAHVIRVDALALVASIAALPPDEVRGTIGVLAALNPGVRRCCLDMIDRHAACLADELLRETPGRSSAAFTARMRAYGAQLAWIYLAIFDESGWRLARGDSPRAVAKAIRPIITGLIDDLDRTPVPEP
jgi:AcrR family transcriptional regulator